MLAILKKKANFAAVMIRKAILMMSAVALIACGDSSMKKTIEARKAALRQKQEVELKRSQEELAVIDSTLEAVKRDYEQQKIQVEQDKQALRATPEELTRLTKTRVLRDSLQTRYEVLCAKIRYIHQKQKEMQEESEE